MLPESLEIKILLSFNYSSKCIVQFNHKLLKGNV